MSHFAVLVAVPEGKTLENVMLPYHEYECTGIEEYTQFVIYDRGELDKEFKEHGKDAKNLEDFARDWAGLVPDTNGNFGRVTNPNKKWDWWEIGGRWSNYLTGNSGTKESLELFKKQNSNVARSLELYDRWHTYRETATAAAKDKRTP